MHKSFPSRSSRAITLWRITLGVSANYLMNRSTDEQAAEALSDIELLRQFKKVEQLPQEKKAVVKELIDAFLLKHDIQQKFA